MLVAVLAHGDEGKVACGGVSGSKRRWYVITVCKYECTLLISVHFYSRKQYFLYSTFHNNEQLALGLHVICVLQHLQSDLRHPELASSTPETPTTRPCLLLSLLSILYSLGLKKANIWIRIE